MRGYAAFLLPVAIVLFCAMRDQHSCRQDITATWVYSGHENELMIYQKKELDKNKPGIQFLENGKLVRRQNVSWCGTPPITYGDFDGT